jgi:hypothetical protein
MNFLKDATTYGGRPTWAGGSTDEERACSLNKSIDRSM